ncbi:hypothetical protein [Dyadobacter pollutisoli]|uniref:Lipoprotein n=1 Tax=Dyadobacter pollutisoli TaxID=2910158 RepID=A0A9E8NIY4_9BACT|nr:hypothetical protein [Dyadobacter pollutisoli]WAC15132.1 hypothetical protein ON006_14425 [Dyadobacter pollutisoli]
MLRLSIISCLSFLSLLLFSFSCADHVVPTNPVPAQIKTLDAFRSIGQTGAEVSNFGVQFENLGNIPITEYGVIFVHGSLVATPTMNNSVKLIIASPADLNQKFRGGPGLLFAPVEPVIMFSYRAYAMLSNGSVVFGEVKSVSFAQE